MLLNNQWMKEKKNQKTLKDSENTTYKNIWDPAKAGLRGEIIATNAYLFFFFYFILLYNTVLVLPYINMNPPWVYLSSQS